MTLPFCIILMTIQIEGIIILYITVLYNIDDNTNKWMTLLTICIILMTIQMDDITVLYNIDDFTNKWMTLPFCIILMTIPTNG